MIQVPPQFRPHINTTYPPHNEILFEEYFSERWNDSLYTEYELDREYLPVHWTSYYVNNKYGKDQSKLDELQSFIKSLDDRTSFFTVLQYDDGILNDISKLDIKVFGSGGGRIDSPIALLTAPHPFHFRSARTIFCSFAGSMTHPIRKQMVNAMRGKISMPKRNIPIKDYCELLSRSVFHLCPRGYGESSFRICEAMQFGAIPVYVSDKHIIPYGVDFNEYGVIIHADQVRDIDRILRGFTAGEISSKQEAGKRIYQELYTFEGARKWILQNI